MNRSINRIDRREKALVIKQIKIVCQERCYGYFVVDSKKICCKIVILMLLKNRDQPQRIQIHKQKVVVRVNCVIRGYQCNQW